MRRTGNLFPKIVDRDNLLRAFQQAARGKSQSQAIRAVRCRLDAELAALRTALSDGTVPFGRSTQFVIRDPKVRVITAPAFRERIVHHAIVNVCEPVFERWLIDDTFACRPGRGREAAVKRAATFSGRFAWRMHLDVRQYFDSVPHDRLLELLGRRFKDKTLLALFAKIVRSYRGGSGRGLPIGSLTSQHFANFFLGWLDRFIKEKRHVKGYVRYMDDMVVWSNTRDELLANRDAVRAFLSHELGLTAKSPNVGLSARGVDFLGCRVFPTHTILSRRSRKRFGRRVRMLSRSRRLGLINDAEVQRRLDAVVAFARGANARSWKFRQSVVKSSEVGDP